MSDERRDGNGTETARPWIAAFLNLMIPRDRFVSTGRLAAIFLMIFVTASAQPAAGWKSLAPLPDPIGYAGMAAGVLGGRLVATGGSQWDHPIWRNGTRSFTDRLFVLDALGGGWRAAVARLPVPSGHFASASADDALYLAGGNSATGSLAAVYVIKPDGNDFRLARLPDLPAPTGYAAAAVAGGRLFVVGGVPDPASKAARREVWSLDLRDPVAWSREADLPGPGVIVPAAAGKGGELFVFGGMTFGADGKPTPSRAACRLPRAGGEWEILPDLPEPRVGAASPCPVLPDDTIWLVGGYAEVWGGAQREHPGFSEQTLILDPSRRAWRRGPVLPREGQVDRDASSDPGPLPMIAAPAVVWQGQVVIIGGEVRVATRTPAVLAWPLHED
jgi:N-acetylneuraminate epimerase